MSGKKQAQINKPQTKTVSIQVGTKKQPPKPSRRRRFNNRIRRSRVPAAFGSSFSSYAKQYQTRSGASRLKVREVFPFTVDENNILDVMIPFTPSKWVGTRTAAIASTFASFRPLTCRVHYQPNSGTATPGTVSIGTAFAGIRLQYTTRDTAASALIGTNGGFQTTVWKNASSRIELRTNLRANNFPTNDIQPDDIPFWILGNFHAGTVTGTVGHLVIETIMALTNPITTIAPALPATPQQTVIEHTAEPPASILKIPASDALSFLRPGREIWFAPMKNMTNGAGAVLASILQSVVGTVASVANDFITFTIDPNFAAQTLKTVIGGSTGNFQ